MSEQGLTTTPAGMSSQVAESCAADRQRALQEHLVRAEMLADQCYAWKSLGCGPVVDLKEAAKHFKRAAQLASSPI